MKLNDLEISTQLKVSLGTILVFIVLLGAIAGHNANLIWQQAEGLYRHPMTVLGAVGDLCYNVLAIHRDMKDLFLARNDDEVQKIIQNIVIYETDAQKQLEILSERYLGPRTDIDEVRISLVQWKAIREETIRILRSGDRDNAAQRTRSAGIGGNHAEQLLAHVKDVSDFANKKATEFYQNASKLHNSLYSQIVAIVSLLTVLTAVLGYFLFRWIRQPLHELIMAAQEFQNENFSIRSSFVSRNEFGTLSRAFNQMADAISQRIETEEKNAAIAKTLIIANELKKFAESVLQKFIEVTESNMGAFYVRTKDSRHFSPLATTGVNPELLETFDAEIFEGEFGQALKTGQVSHIRNIQQETVFKFKTFAGTCVPGEIITIPVVVNGKVLAMLSLASLGAYSEAALNVLSQPSLIALNTAFANLLANDETRQMAEKLRESNHELIAQQEELQSQAEELQTQTEELHKQNIELERQRLAVEEATRLKSAFLSNMSHELRTPLNSVMALSKVMMMQAGNKLSSEELNYLEIIRRNGKNLLTLINEILDLAKIESGRMNINPRAFAPGQTIENIIESLAPLAREKNIEIRAEITKDIELLESDELRVHAILQNLIANAVKFTAVGRITVKAKSTGERFVVQVEDTGIGISTEDLPYIFDEFRQVDGSSARKHEGTGLGLAIARKTARMLGGEIAATSIYGQGSTFTLTLPLVWRGAEPIREDVVSRINTGIKSARKTVLVVDDEPEAAAMVSRYLLQEGYNTITATSGEEALKLAAREHPFAITLDIMMPDMDGWEVMQGLKNNHETRDIPVIIVSISEDQATGFALGAIGYVTKPVSRGLLISEINKIGKPVPCSIMIVDDNETDRQEIERIIQGEGMTPIMAESGSDCLELLGRNVPDILVLDLMMPGIDGFAILESIRRNQETRDLPVIVVTAKDLTEDDRKKLAGSVSSVLEKSMALPAILLQEIKRSLRSLDALQKQRVSKKSPGRPRILLVEDNEVAIIQVKSFLESANYIAGVARNAQEAFAYVASTIPDGIILDLMMPEIDGFEVLEKIRSTEATAQIPVLILTARDLTAEDLRRLSSNNVKQLVQKGNIDREGLLDKIASLITKKPTILIMEDNSDNMATFKAVLLSSYQIIAATDGEMGLQMAARIMPDLIVLDMSLPKVDGFTVVGQLKSDVQLRNIPVIAVTARVMKGDREKIIQAGCDDYIAKPIDPEQFLAKIDEWLKG